MYLSFFLIALCFPFLNLNYRKQVDLYTTMDLTFHPLHYYYSEDVHLENIFLIPYILRDLKIHILILYLHKAIQKTQQFLLFAHFHIEMAGLSFDYPI